MRISILFLLTLLLTGCGGEKTEPEYIAEIDQWHAGRIERLRSDTGWLTLVGLHPLPMGVHSLGASADADISLAAGAPYWLGSVAVTEDVDHVLGPSRRRGGTSRQTR